MAYDARTNMELAFFRDLARRGGSCRIARRIAAGAAKVGRIQPMEPLKESSGGTTGRGARRVQILVVVELAVSLSLLMATASSSRMEYAAAR